MTVCPGFNQSTKHIQTRDWKEIHNLLSPCTHLQSVELLGGKDVEADAFEVLASEIHPHMTAKSTSFQFKTQRSDKVESGRDLVPEMFGEPWQRRFVKIADGE